MKIITLLLLSVFGLLIVSAQSTVPSEIKFDRTVEQKLTDKKNETKLIYYFTTSGDYAAIRPEGKNNNALIIYNKEGKMIMVNEKEKSIIIMDMKGMLEKAIKKGEDMAKEDKDNKASFRKTGNTKTICGYSATEYEITTEKEKMNVWFIKTDFVSFPLLAMGMGGGISKVAKSGSIGDLPSLGKNFFLAETQKDDKTIIETTRIAKDGFTLSTSGYTIQDMSDLMKGRFAQ